MSPSVTQQNSLILLLPLRPRHGCYGCSGRALRCLRHGHGLGNRRAQRSVNGHRPIGASVGTACCSLFAWADRAPELLHSLVRRESFELCGRRRGGGQSLGAFCSSGATPCWLVVAAMEPRIFLCLPCGTAPCALITSTSTLLPSPVTVKTGPFRAEGGGEGPAAGPSPAAPERSISGEGRPSPPGLGGFHFVEFRGRGGASPNTLQWPF